MKIAITGATGFLGRHVVSQLAPAHELCCISRSGKAPEGLSGVSADVTDAAALKKAFEGCELVVHGAGMVSHSAEDSDRLWDVHVTGTEKVVEACKAAGIRRLVHISTSGTVAVSDDPDFQGREDMGDPLQTIASWPYYRSKLFAEHVAHEAADSSLEVVILNPSLLLGPGDDLLGASTDCVRIFLDSSIPFPPPGGLSFVDVRDVAVAVELALESGGKTAERYLLGPGNLSFYDFYSCLARITGRSAPMAALPRRTGRLLQMLPGLGKERGLGFGATLSREQLDLACHYWYVNDDKARTQLGWTPRDPIRTLEDTVWDIQTRRREAAERYRAQ
jgi:dihydroflavonol-4-reductase